MPEKKGKEEGSSILKQKEALRGEAVGSIREVRTAARSAAAKQYSQALERSQANMPKTLTPSGFLFVPSLTLARRRGREILNQVLGRRVLPLRIENALRIPGSERSGSKKSGNGQVTPRLALISDSEQRASKEDDLTAENQRLKQENALLRTALHTLMSQLRREPHEETGAVRRRRSRASERDGIDEAALAATSAASGCGADEKSLRGVRPTSRRPRMGSGSDFLEGEVSQEDLREIKSDILSPDGSIKIGTLKVKYDKGSCYGHKKRTLRLPIRVITKLTSNLEDGKLLNLTNDFDLKQKISDASKKTDEYERGEISYKEFAKYMNMQFGLNYTLFEDVTTKTMPPKPGTHAAKVIERAASGGGAVHGRGR